MGRAPGIVAVYSSLTGAVAKRDRERMSLNGVTASKMLKEMVYTWTSRRMNRPRLDLPTRELPESAVAFMSGA